MDVTRRDLVKLLAVAAGAGVPPRRLEAADGPARLLAFEPLGNVTLLHITDAHATLRPVFYREPDTVLGVGAERGRPPFLTGAELLRAYHVAPGSVEAYAYTYLDFPALAARYGRMGGYAHLATLVKRIRAERSRSEEHTSELQSRLHLVCRLLLEKKKKTKRHTPLQSTTHK